jgi:hypothetical protein
LQSHERVVCWVTDEPIHGTKSVYERRDNGGIGKVTHRVSRLADHESILRGDGVPEQLEELFEIISLRKPIDEVGEGLLFFGGMQGLQTQ